MARNIIPFELREGKDDDIAKALENAVTEESSRSSIIRSALRQYLFGQKECVEIEVPMKRVSFDKTEKDDTKLDDALNDLLNF